MVEQLGEVTVPSGTLQVFDVGALALVEGGQIPSVPHVRIHGIPVNRALPILGVRVVGGEWDGTWDHLRVVVDGNSRVESLAPAGDVIVDYARIMFADASIDEHWQHSTPIDGRADFIFWGRDAQALASLLSAPQVDDASFGWLDLPTDEAVALGIRAQNAMESSGLRLATDFRPHSHHYLALSTARIASSQAASIDVGPLRVCLVLTRCGDGVFPVLRELDALGRLVGVRVQLAVDSDESQYSG